MPFSRFAHLAWPLTGFENLAGHERTQTRYPIRFARYWFVRSLLERLHRELGRPLRVLEVGIGDGAMRRFTGGPRGADGALGLPDWVESWTALDVQALPGVLERHSYSGFIKADLEKDFVLPAGGYDAVVLLHVLEHLFDPEAALDRLGGGLAPGGLLLGGSPTMPAPLAALHERWLRHKFRAVLDDVTAHRHLSVISPARLRRYARRRGLGVELLTGAFMLRFTNSPLENHAGWMKANLAWGLVPPLGGEVYFSLRK